MLQVLEFIVNAAHSKVMDWFERKPLMFPISGVLASVTGLVASIAASLQMVSLVIGVIGAFFGALAGYYTFRIQRLRWLRYKQNPATLDRHDQQQVN